MIELKPCPFCGGKAKITYYHHYDYLTDKVCWVSCTKKNCKVNPETDGFETEGAAIKAWNKRAGGQND